MTPFESRGLRQIAKLDTCGKNALFMLCPYFLAYSGGFVLQKTPRFVALDILCRVDAGAYADHLLETHRDLSILSPVDRNLLHQLVLGTVTWRDRLDVILQPYLGRPLAKQPPQLRNLLRLGVFQLQHLDRVPTYAVVSESVAIARQVLGASLAKLVNAVLRGVSEDRKPAVFPQVKRNPVGHLATTLSHPEWMVRRWVARYGFDEAKQLCQANNVQSVLTIRPNRFKTTRDGLRARLLGEGIETEDMAVNPFVLSVPHPGELFRTQSFREGLFSVQGAGAAWVVPLLDPQPGDWVLDVCSAPGGKTTAAAELMRNEGRVVAVDVYVGRQKTVRENAHRLGLDCIRILTADVHHLALHRSFDRVLVDAPCSALGILNHHPDARWRRKGSDVVELSVLQGTILKQASRLVRSGGVLVYSTCTLEPEENEGVVSAFLADQTDFYMESVSDVLSLGSGPYLHLTPHEHGTDGVFAARLRRR